MTIVICLGVQQATGVTDLKLFFFDGSSRKNKLECLSLWSIFEASQIYASTACHLTNFIFWHYICGAGSQLMEQSILDTNAGKQ
jgi:hypothetical protein